MWRLLLVAVATALIAATVAASAPAPLRGTLVFGAIAADEDDFYAAFSIDADGTRLRRLTRWHGASA